MNLVLHLSSTSYIPLIFSLTYLTFLHVIYLPVCVYIYIYIYIYMFYTILHLLESLIIVLHYSTLHVCIMLYYVSSLEKNGMYICIIFFKYI